MVAVGFFKEATTLKVKEHISDLIPLDVAFRVVKITVTY
jgi:hypothetical protein